MGDIAMWAFEILGNDVKISSPNNSYTHNFGHSLFFLWFDFAFLIPLS